MRKRPTSTFMCVMRKEEPSDRNKLIRIYKKGGIEFEDYWKERLRGISNKFPYISNEKNNKGVYGNWLYVGDSWWCRRTKKYEFARLVAVNRDRGADGKDVIEGLWDSRRHDVSKPPCWIYKDGRRGVIVSHNEFEINVSWEAFSDRSVFESLRSLEGVTFEFEEDFKKYTKIAAGFQK